MRVDADWARDNREQEAPDVHVGRQRDDRQCPKRHTQPNQVVITRIYFSQQTKSVLLNRLNNPPCPPPRTTSSFPLTPALAPRLPGLEVKLAEPRGGRGLTQRV